MMSWGVHFSGEKLTGKFMKTLVRKKRSLTPTERQAEIAKSVRLKKTSILKTIKEVFQCSYSHYRLTLTGERRPSRGLAERIAGFVNMSVFDFWGMEHFNSPNQSNVLPQSTDD
jgi:hypothetical protein